MACWEKIAKLTPVAVGVAPSGESVPAVKARAVLTRTWSAMCQSWPSRCHRATGGAGLPGAMPDAMAASGPGWLSWTTSPSFRRWSN